jgi:hypothetical protein
MEIPIIINTTGKIRLESSHQKRPFKRIEAKDITETAVSIKTGIKSPLSLFPKM